MVRYDEELVNCDNYLVTTVFSLCMIRYVTLVLSLVVKGL